jgi:hypothetical protein
LKTCNLSCIIGIFEEVQTSKGVIFFLKYPRKGKIKTRLAKAFGDTFVLKLYKCFIRDMLVKLRVKILLQWWDVDDGQDMAAFFERNMNSDFSESRTMRFLVMNQEELLKKVRDKNFQMSHQIP